MLMQEKKNRYVQSAIMKSHLCLQMESGCHKKHLILHKGNNKVMFCLYRVQSFQKSTMFMQCST